GDARPRRASAPSYWALKYCTGATEWAGRGNAPSTRWTWFSVVLSISSTLVGGAVQQGLLAVVLPLDL
ncbi:serine hydrolase, partial [Pseudomonas aeruginosa]